MSMVEEALARADALAETGHWGGDAQHIRVLADALRETDSRAEKAERARKKAEKPAAKKTETKASASKK